MFPRAGAHQLGQEAFKTIEHSEKLMPHRHPDQLLGGVGS